ncbi:Crp/Fnr family transcriptional regulator [Anaerovorax odorimutans]|uniref:Crp/Fnr family transcriptional regulator n=1 Tax=Anaerovorax odorimutans TaxID=109327 RepID=UPI0004234F1E|nr:Crp/Fnr family transcriptional regulator [Anaerovorax odorimutans]
MEDRYMGILDFKLLEEIFPFWKDLTEAEKDEFARNTNLRNYEKGEHIHGGGQNCTGLIGIKRGRLRVYLLSEEGKEVTLFRLLQGDTCILSASCIVKNISFEIQVEAESQMELLIVNPSVYDKIAKENTAASSFMNELISMRFSEAMWIMEQILFMKLDRRLAIFLIEQSSLEESDIIKLTHQEIADHLGSAREVISRMLKYFSGEGMISVSRRGIKLLDREKLMKMM